MSQLDLSALDQAVILARGQYATVRAAREDAVKVLHGTCTAIQGIPQSILRAAQEGHSIDDDLRRLENLSALLRGEADAVIDLQQQKESLKSVAWGGKPVPGAE